MTLACLGRDGKFLGTKKQSLIQCIALPSWLQGLCFQAKPPPFWPAFPGATEGHSAQARPATVWWSCERWSELMVFPLWLPEMMWIFLEGGIWTDQWSDIPAARWTESLGLEALGESCLWLRTQECWRVMGREREKGWIFNSLALLLPLALLCPLSFPGPRCLSLMWERLKGTIRNIRRCSWCELDREKSALLWMSHNPHIPESCFFPAAASRGWLAEALLTIRPPEWVDDVKSRLFPLSFPALGSSGMVQAHCQTRRGSHVRSVTAPILLCMLKVCWWRCAGSADWVETLTAGKLLLLVCTACAVRSPH